VIPDDAVEAAWAASKMKDRSRASISREEIRHILEAAAPHLMRAAWDEGWEAHGDWGGLTPNPYAKALSHK
jgi:hypothetical protein